MEEPKRSKFEQDLEAEQRLTPFPQHCLRIPAIPGFNFDSILSRQAGAGPDQGELEHLPHRRVHHRCRHHRHLHEDRFLRQVLLTMRSHFLWSEFTNKSE